VSRKIKIYFVDLGIRNSLIQNFNPLSLREDVGALWENFCIVERIKCNSGEKRFVNRYFWRSYSGQEVDYIEESAGRFEAFEYKWNDKKQARVAGEFLAAYGVKPKQINRKNYFEFV
jgi:hypothetical protein